MNEFQMIETLKRDEGLKLTPYKDSRGFLTIGIGHNLDAHGITKETAEFICLDDLAKHWKELVEALPWVKELDEPRQHVMLNMAFNLGVGGLLNFRNTLACIKEGEYANAAIMMLQSKWADQVGQRAVRLAEQMKTGKEQ